MKLTFYIIFSLFFYIANPHQVSNVSHLILTKYSPEKYIRQNTASFLPFLYIL